MKKANKSIMKSFGDWMVDTNLPFKAIESPRTLIH